jgi:hypothetical protein
VCKALPGSFYSLLCSWASGRNEVRARGWHGQAMDKKAGRGEGGECEDARDAAARDGVEWSCDMARRYLAGAREEDGETVEEEDNKQEERYCREKMKGREEERRR